MNVTKDGFKNKQLHIEDYLQMVSAEQKEYTEVFTHLRITEKLQKSHQSFSLNFVDNLQKNMIINASYLFLLRLFQCISSF